MTRERRLAATTDPDVLRPRVQASELGLITAPGISAPVVAPRGLAAPRAALPWSEPAIPIATIRRAFAESDPVRREPILTWAFAIDVEEATEKASLDALNHAMSNERAVRDLRAGLLEAHVPAIWQDFIEREDVRPALAALRARPAPSEITDTAKRWRLPTSPVMRAHELLALHGYPEPPALADLRPFLALADAIEEVHVASGYKVGRSSSPEMLQRSVDALGSGGPRLLDDVRKELERIRRMLDIERRKEAAAEKAAAGIVPRLPSSVGIAPLIREAEEFPPETLIELPEAAATETTQRREAVPIEELEARPAAPPTEPGDGGHASPAAPVEAPPPPASVPNAEVPAPAAQVESPTAPSDRSRALTVACVAIAAAAAIAILLWFELRTPEGSGVQPSSPPASASGPPASAPHGATATLTATSGPAPNASVSETGSPPPVPSAPDTARPLPAPVKSSPGTPPPSATPIPSLPTPGSSTAAPPTSSGPAIIKIHG